MPVVARLPGNLEDVEALLKRRARALERKNLWRSLYQDCYRYAMPQRESFSWSMEGQRKESHLYDSTLQECTYSAANTLCANLVPSWKRWGEAAVAAAVKRELIPDEVVDGLQSATATFFDVLNQSNFAMVAHECAQDIQVGTLGMQFDEGDDDDLFRFSSIPVPAIEIEEGPKGTVENKFICRKVPVSWLPRLFVGMEPAFDWPAELFAMLQTEPDKEVEVLQCELYFPENKHYYGVAVDLKSKAIIWRFDYEDSCPQIIARAAKAPGETYGRGRVTRALSDARTLDKMVEFMLRSAAVQIAPPMTGVSDGVLNPYTASLVPNTVIPVASNDSQNPSLRPLEIGGNLAFSENMVEKLRERVRTVMLGPEPLPAGSTPPSASQVRVHDRDRLWNMNGEYSRLQVEWLVPVFIRGMKILQKRGLVPQFKIDGRLVRVVFTSPFANSQNTDDVLALQDTLATVAPLGPAVVMGGLKVEDMPGWVARKNGVDVSLIRTDDERKELADKATEAASQAVEAGVPAEEVMNAGAGALAGA